MQQLPRWQVKPGVDRLMGVVLPVVKSQDVFQSYLLTEMPFTFEINEMSFTPGPYVMKW